MQRIPIVFATCSELASLTEDDRLVIPHAERLGLDVAPACWDDPTFDWARPALVAIRSTWDYSERVEEYRAWLRRCAKLGARLFNEPATVEWNLDKNYLREFGDLAVPTRWVKFESAQHLREEIQASGWREVVVKPAVSVGARGTERLTGNEPTLPEYALGRELMIQPFLPAIVSRGEWSLIYFDGKLSHSAIKKPKAHDFRVQDIHGGSLENVEPPRAAVRAAEVALSKAPGDLLYARVDLVETEAGFRLMELEINEPGLYFKTSAEAAPNFARALAARVA